MRQEVTSCCEDTICPRKITICCGTNVVSNSHWKSLILFCFSFRFRGLEMCAATLSLFFHSHRLPPNQQRNLANSHQHNDTSIYLSPSLDSTESPLWHLSIHFATFCRPKGLSHAAARRWFLPPLAVIHPHTMLSARSCPVNCTQPGCGCVGPRRDWICSFHWPPIVSISEQAYFCITKALN